MGDGENPNQRPANEWLGVDPRHAAQNYNNTICSENKLKPDQANVITRTILSFKINEEIMIKTALLSVSDKTSVPARAGSAPPRRETALDWRHGQTARHAGLLGSSRHAHRFPEMLDAASKPCIRNPRRLMLARRDLPEHMAALTEHGT